MKTRIIVGVSVLFLALVAWGIGIVASIGRSTEKLETLVRLHRVEILRERFLIEIRKAQSDLYLRNTRHAQNIDTFVAHVRDVDEAVETCFGCHHTEAVNARLRGVEERVEQYKGALSTLLTIRANEPRLAAAEDRAYRIGADLVAEVNDIVALTAARLQQRTETAFAQIQRTKTLLYWTLAVTAVLAGGLAAVLIRGFTRPIEVLLAATRRLKGGDLDHRVEGLRDEFGEVASSLNEMAASLKEYTHRMQWAEQVVVLGELAGGLAHEINNPVAGIKASMELMAEDPAIQGENREIVLEVGKQIRRIEMLVKNMLDFARPPKPQLTLLDVNDAVDAALATASRHPLFSRNAPRAIAIVREYDASLPKVQVDVHQLQQVLLNLILNAADAMAEGGTLTARTARDDGGAALRITIADTGRGVDESVRERIFLPFVTTKAKGTGLGLAITKRLVEQHGGTIAVADNPGGGAAFTITLPVEAPRAAA